MSYRHARNYHDSTFIRNAMSGETAGNDELEKYLQSGLAGDEVTDVLNWWKVMLSIYNLYYILLIFFCIGYTIV